MAHAEIEAFIEDITLQVAKNSVSEWTRTKKSSDVLVCLMAHYHFGFDVENDNRAPIFSESSRPKTKDAIKEVVDIAFLQYKKIHEKNHGVRETNLKRLALPIGVRKDDLDPTWLTNLDEFGKRRGDVAHNTVKAQQQIDPKAELQDVQNLLLGLDLLDKLVLKLAA